MSDSLGSGPAPTPPQAPPQAPPRVGAQKTPATSTAALRQRLAELRGPAVPPLPLDARALAALAANPGCKRRALLDGAGVDKAALAAALGSPSAFGQSQFAFMRGNAFEAKVKADGAVVLMQLLYERMGAGSEPPAPGETRLPDLSAAGPEGRAARTALALREATAAGAWTLLDHPMLALEVAGSPAYLEPDAVVVHPDGRWTVVEIKSFPMIDDSADAAKVGAAARQAAVYVLALERVAAMVTGADSAAAGAGRDGDTGRDATADVGPDGTVDATAITAADADAGPSPDFAPDTGPDTAPDTGPVVGHSVLLVCPKDFSNLPTASVVDVRKQRSVTRRQLERLTRIEDLAAALPEGTTFDLERPAQELTAAVESVDAAYAPECLAACEMAFHCREKARAAGTVEALGRSVRGELGGLTTIGEVLAAAEGTAGDPLDPTVAALRRAAHLRSEALAAAGKAAACR